MSSPYGIGNHTYTYHRYDESAYEIGFQDLWNIASAVKDRMATLGPINFFKPDLGGRGLTNGNYPSVDQGWRWVTETMIPTVTGWFTDIPILRRGVINGLSQDSKNAGTLRVVTVSLLYLSEIYDKDGTQMRRGLESIRYQGNLLYYRVTMAGVVLRHDIAPNRYPWWNRMNDQVIVGALPLSNRSHVSALLRENVGAVVSCVETMELENGGPFFTPVKPRMWKEVRVNWHHLNMRDLLSPDIERLDHYVCDVISLASHLPSSQSIYIHCKAGQGRSIMVVMAYLMKTKRLSYQTAEHEVTSRRKNTLLNPFQKAALQYYEIYLHKQRRFLDRRDRSEGQRV